MAVFSALNDVSKLLQKHCIDALNAAVEIGFSASTDSFVLAPPSGDLGADVIASLYLYHVGLDPHKRNLGVHFDPINHELAVPGSLPLKLNFLIVPLHSDEDNNQLLLGRILQQFHDHPVLTPAPGTPLDQSRVGPADQIRVRLDLGSHQELAALWSGLARPFRLSAGLVVDIVSIDSARPSERMPRVQDVVGSLRNTKEAAGQ